MIDMSQPSNVISRGLSASAAPKLSTSREGTLKLGSSPSTQEVPEILRLVNSIDSELESLTQEFKELEVKLSPVRAVLPGGKKEAPGNSVYTPLGSQLLSILTQIRSHTEALAELKHSVML